MGLLSGYQTPERRWIQEEVLLSASWSIEIVFGGQSLPWLGKGKCGERYCQFTNISMGRSIGQASSGALGNSSIVPTIRTDGNLHLHVGIWLALTPLFHSDSGVHFLLFTSVWSATTTHSIRKLSLLSLFAWSIQSRCLIEKKLWCLKESWTVVFWSHWNAMNATNNVLALFLLKLEKTFFLSRIHML